MKLSVALCTYNGEKFLKQQLDSIAAQTLQPDELVVCDDRSKDSTLAILQDFSEQVSFPVHIHQNETNLGSTRNFEKAIKLCQGEIIALCDQDDVWTPNKLKRLVEELDNHPDAGYAFSDAELVDEQLNPLGRRLWNSISFKGEFREKFFQGKQFECFLKHHIVTGATMACRKEIAAIAMPFPTSGRWIHDGWISLISSAIGAKGVPIDEALIKYRQHSNQQIGAPKVEVEVKLSKPKTLLQMYRELQKNKQVFFEAWVYRNAKTVSITSNIKNILAEKNLQQPSLELNRNLSYLQRFETHFVNRRNILTSRHPRRYWLILRETVSGRYKQFSDSWRSIFRDLFFPLN